TTNTQTVTVNFTDLDKPDLNWTYYMPRPKKIKVEAYFTDASSKLSKYDDKCKVELQVNSVDPTPTPNPACVCGTNGSCTNECFLDKFPVDVNYTTPLKCSLGNELFQSVPTADQKTGWCRAYKRPRGDANSDGIVRLLDYFYYVSVQAGSKVPATVNIDFNGDNLISLADRAILIKSLK
ncbi:MAG: hypothetical protein Q7U68_07985, partial [Candidatus Roizmanbacteria bacterium]|nr:hypothetical protein [Candidatus Roizmanbacteria bacterium]